jgi:hypothetical protein
MTAENKKEDLTLDEQLGFLRLQQTTNKKKVCLTEDDITAGAKGVLALTKALSFYEKRCQCCDDPDEEED